MYFREAHSALRSPGTSPNFRITFAEFAGGGISAAG